MTTRSIRTLSALLLLALGSAANAATLTFAYLAEVTDIDGSAAAIQFLNDAGIGHGTDAIGSVVLTDGVADSAAGDPSLGIYVGAVTNFSLELNGIDATYDDSFNDVYVSDAAEDILLATGGVNYGNPGFGSGLAGLQLRDSTGNAWNGDGIPFDNPFNIIDFDSYVPLDPEGTALLLDLTVNGEQVTIFAEIKLLEAKVVPLPAAVWMMGFALLSLAGVARKR